MSDVGKGSGGRKPLRIFLSSTSEDLGEHRARAAEVIERLEQQSVRMETFGASPRSPVDVCRRKVVSADALVVIVAHRYGWVPGPEKGGDGAKSITWYEVEAALEDGKPVYAFVVNPEHPWTGPREQDRLVEAENEEEVQAVGAAVRGLKELKTFLGAEVTWESFTTPDDLAAKMRRRLAGKDRQGVDQDLDLAHLMPPHQPSCRYLTRTTATDHPAILTATRTMTSRRRCRTSGS